jgi:alcohol dehydrogenase (cytochrome c)
MRQKRRAWSAAGSNNCGAALYEAKVFRTTLDANVVALEAATGRELWRQKVIGFRKGYAETVGPLLPMAQFDHRDPGAEYSTRDFIDGRDAQNGKHL